MPLRFYKEGEDYTFGSTAHESIYLGQVDETPTDAEIDEGNTAFYAKPDGNLYKRPHGGAESGIGGDSGGGSFDHMLTEALDAQENDINNVGALQAEETTIVSEGAADPYSDDFTSDTSGQWTVHSGSPTWWPDEGRVEGDDGTLATHSERTFGTGVYSTIVETHGSQRGHIGPVWGLQSPDAFYHVRIRQDQDAIQLYSFSSEGATLLGEASEPLVAATQYTLTVDWDADAGQIDVYFDDESRSSSPVISVEDSTYSSGEYGFRCFGGVGSIHSASYFVEAAETHIDNESVETTRTEANQGNIKNISGTVVAPNATTLQNQKRDWSWEDIDWEDKGGPIIAHDQSSSPDGATYPTLLNAEAALDNPIDTYYMYWSGHDDPCGIELSTAPHPWGPWTFQSTVIPGDTLGGGHVASPSALVDPSNDRLNLYVHSNENTDGGQQTHLMTGSLTGDGTTFTQESKVLTCPFDRSWDEQERSYMKVRRVGRTYWGVYQGRDRSNNTPGIGVAYSLDGETWQTDTSPAFDNTQWMDYGPQKYPGGSPALSTVGGIPYIHYGDRGTPSAARALPLADKDRALFQPGESVMGVPSWSSSSGVNIHEFWTDEEYIYAYYYVAEDLDTEVGVARAKLGGVF